MNTRPAISLEGIATTGVGRSAVTPDTLTLQLGSQITADSVQAALDRVAADSDTLLDLIETMNVPRHRVQTGRIAVHPQWNYTEAGQHLIGYQVTIEHAVSVTSTESAGSDHRRGGRPPRRPAHHRWAGLVRLRAVRCPRRGARLGVAGRPDERSTTSRPRPATTRSRPLDPGRRNPRWAGLPHGVRRAGRRAAARAWPIGTRGSGPGAVRVRRCANR